MAKGKIVNKQPAKPLGLKVIHPQPRQTQLANGPALAAGIAAYAGPLVAIGATHALKGKPAAKPRGRGHSQKGAITTSPGVVTPLATATAPASTGDDYASGQTGGSAAGFGSNYGGDPLTAGQQGGSGSDSTDAPAAAAKPAGSWLGPKTKLWLIVGGGVALVVFGYGYYKYRQVTWPLRKYRQIRRAATNLISTAKA